MSLNAMFDTIDKTREAASWAAAFGEPQTVGGQTIIPVARVAYGYSFGFGPRRQQPEVGQPASPAPGDESGVGGALTRPLGALVVTPERVRFEATVDPIRVILAGCAVGTLFIFQLAKTLRVLFGSE